MNVLLLASAEDEDWLRMRSALWPDATRREHKMEMASFLDAPDKFTQFIARAASGEALGFVEASIRSDYVNGTEHSPVAFLEGIYVKQTARRQGVGRALVAAVEGWAREAGCRELASDASTRNRASHSVHKRLGFAETERVVYFNKRLS